MSATGNTIGILIPQPAAPAAVSAGSANPPEPLTNAAGPVEVVEMVADVASSALSLIAPDSAAADAADAVSELVSLAAMIPGLPGPKPPSRKTVSGFSGGIGMGFDGGVVTSGHGHCIPCKVAAAVGKPVNAVLGIKVLFDDTEADFTLDSPLPLIWQRSYYSDQPGNGWLGQGWSLPFSPCALSAPPTAFFISTSRGGKSRCRTSTTKKARPPLTKTTSKKKPKSPTNRKTTPTAWPAAGSTVTNKSASPASPARTASIR